MMPAGQYYIGDLCYVMHDKWDEVCNKTFEGPIALEGEFKLDSGVRFANFSTMHGDGEYYDQIGNSYGVDSGSIGCILVKDISESDKENINDGCVMEFDEPFEVFSEEGKLIFGDVEIDTDFYDDED